MPGPKLFEPLTVGDLHLANRIVIAPMCQYSAVDGAMTDWHSIHLGHLALSGAALLTIEATAVVPEGRISYGDVGLWDDATEAAMAKVLAIVRRHSDMPIAIQLAHAGRKASTELPWRGGKQIAPDAANGWQTVSASALPFEKGENAPLALDRAGLDRVRDGFVDAARRAQGSASTRCSSMVRTAICSTNSFHRSRTGARTNMVAVWRTGCAFRSKSSMRSVRHSRRKSL